MRAKIAELEGDRDRLDWLQTNYAHFCVTMVSGAPWICTSICRDTSGDVVKADLRAAIDAARKSQ